MEAFAGNLEQPDHPLDVRELVLDAAREAAALLERSNDLETSSLVAQIRSTGTDLLQATSMGPNEAFEALEGGLAPRVERVTVVRASRTLCWSVLRQETLTGTELSAG